LNANNVSLGQTRLTAVLLVKTAGLVTSGAVSLQAAKEKILPEVIQGGADPKVILEQKGLKQVSDDSQLTKWIGEVIRENPKVVGDYKSGKDTAAMFLVGQVMKKSQGKANPVKVKELLIQDLSR
jgi:aspartyl-tRNA(Asn)/glutamyl-tRNA(Gln) amidotransferase subunit B